MNISTDIKQHALKLYSATLSQVILRWDQDDDFSQDLSNVEALNDANEIVSFSKKLMKDYFESEND